MAKVVIVIPTYNEIEGTKKMIPALADFFATVKDHEMHLLYADDMSPDGTYKVVQEFQKEYDWLHLTLNNEKIGIGGAYLRAFKYARDELKADYIMEFDADFQHRIEDIPKFLDQIKNEPDLVIGSRYIRGGSIPSEWKFIRKFFSVVGNLICRIGFLTPRIHDFTTGFKLTKVKGGLDKVPLDNIYSNSFAYKIQITAEIANKGGKIVEVPIIFKPRTEGESKLVKNELGDFLRVIFLFQINNPKIKRFLKFGTVGFVGYVVNAVGLEVFSKMSFPEWAIWAAATEMAIISNFILNNIWTFKAEKITGVSQIIKKFMQFNGTSVGALVIQAVFGSLGVLVLGPQSRQLLLPFIIVFLVLPYNYFMYNAVIWKTWKLPFLERFKNKTSN